MNDIMESYFILNMLVMVIILLCKDFALWGIILVMLCLGIAVVQAWLEKRLIEGSESNER